MALIQKVSCIFGYVNKSDILTMTFKVNFSNLMINQPLGVSHISTILESNCLLLKEILVREYICLITKNYLRTNLSLVNSPHVFSSFFENSVSNPTTNKSRAPIPQSTSRNLIKAGKKTHMGWPNSGILFFNH